MRIYDKIKTIDDMISSLNERVPPLNVLVPILTEIRWTIDGLSEEVRYLREELDEMRTMVGEHIRLG